MEITEVRISPSKGGKIRAFASIVIDDCFIVNDLRVMEGREGQLFVTMPARKARNGQMRDIAHPLNSDTRRVDRGAGPGRVSSGGRANGGSGSAEAMADPERQSAIDRLASKLFSDDFWSSDSARGDPGREDDED